MSGQSSRTTHGAVECIEACQLFGAMLFSALNADRKDKILVGHGLHNFTSEGVRNIAAGQYFDKSIDEIHGSGYVVQSLEAALWCFYHTDNFKDAILMAANLGDDADTTAAICGQIAGAYYGYNGIPQAWREKIVFHAEILALAKRLYAR